MAINDILATQAQAGEPAGRRETMPSRYTTMSSGEAVNNAQAAGQQAARQYNAAVAQMSVRGLLRTILAGVLLADVLLLLMVIG